MEINQENLTKIANIFYEKGQVGGVDKDDWIAGFIAGFNENYQDVDVSKSLLDGKSLYDVYNERKYK